MPHRSRFFLQAFLWLAVTGAVLAGERVVAEEGSRPNVFLFNIDMLRADHLGVYGYERDTSPELDRIAREGVWFSAARAHAPWTYPSVVSLLSGVYPTSHGATYSELKDEYVTTTVSPELETIATMLKRAGYTTAGFITNPLLKKSSGLNRGFDVFEDEFVRSWKRWSGTPWSTEAMNAENVHRTVLAWLDQKPRVPLFMYVHYIDVHGPYLEPRAWGQPAGTVSSEDAEKARLTGEPRQLAIDVYDGEIRRLDGLIGQFLSDLESRGLLEDAIVIVTADHGEEFGDHGGFGHGHTLYEEMLHVPLIVMRTGSMPHTRKIDSPVGHVDLLPTIAELAGAEVPSGAVGRSLVPLLRGEDDDAPRPLLSEMDNRGRPVWNSKPGAPVVAYSLLVPPATKYVVGGAAPFDPASSTDDKVAEQIFDLSRDPKESAPSNEPTDAKQRAKRFLARTLEEARASAIAPGVAPLDESTQKRLRALGYLPD